VLPTPQAGTDAAIGALVDLLAAHPADVVLTSGDAWLAMLHGARDGLRGARAAIGSREAVAIAMSKPRTLAVAAELGIPAPRTVEVEDVDAGLAAVAELGLPVVVKPSASWRPDGEGGDRLSPTLCRTLDEARAAVADLARPGAPVLVQEVAPGDRETHKLFVAGGRVIARVVMRPERCWPPLGGSSTMRVTIEAPSDSSAHAERLVREIGLEGYSEVEFRRCAEGRPLLMEINARLSQSIEVARRAGVDFARLQLEWARGGPLTAVPGYRVGVRVGWLAGDARHVAASHGRSAPAVGSDYLTGARIEGLDLRDPRPLLAALAFNARGLVRMVRSGRATRRGTPLPSP
jgi:predicted ATP-grasp superfamily ATP-dependent carboligase